MSLLTSPKTYGVLAALHAVDAVGCAVEMPFIMKSLDDVGVPVNIRPVFPVVKNAAAVGLVSVARFPSLARLTTAMLTLYYALAVGAHIRVGNKNYKAIPAASFLALFAVMMVKGPDHRHKSFLVSS
jgi:DoxX-like family